MKSITNQYRDLKEGKMSQSNFMRNVRMAFPQYVTNTTSFDDAIRILKHKSLLSEAIEPSAAPSNDEDAEVEAIIKKIEQELEGEEAVMGQYDLEEKYPQAGKDGYIKVSQLKKGDTLGGSGLEVVSVSAGANTPSGKVEVTVKDPQTGKELTKTWNKSTTVRLKEGKELNPNQIHPSELRMGIQVEMEHTDDPEKAKKIALDHLAENPFYYTALKLSGIDSPSKPKAKPVKEKKSKKKKDQTELVDKDNQMKKIKVVKENQLNEAGGEYTFNGYFKTAEEKQKLLNMIPDAEIDTDAEEGQSVKTTVSSFKYNDVTIKKAVENALGMNQSRPQAGGEGVASFLNKLREVIREVVDEYYDGRDNLTDLEDIK